jgi:hypothetical protein
MQSVTLRAYLSRVWATGRWLTAHVPGIAAHSPKRNTLVVLVYLFILSIGVTFLL